MWKIIFAVLSVATMFVGVDCSGKAIKVTEAWSRATPADATTAEVFLHIQNKLDGPDTLTAVTTYIAESAVIMSTANEDGTATPHTIANLAIPQDKDVQLLPNRTYILLQKLKQPLKAGDKFPLTLTFVKGGDVLEDVVIEPAGTLAYTK